MPTPLVADAITHYRELFGRLDTTEWARSHIADVEQHWHDEAAMSSYVLRPFFIDEDEYAARASSLALVMRGIGIATEKLATDVALRRALGIPAYMEPLIVLDTASGKPTCLGRLDAIPTADGRLMAIELNSEPQSVPFQYELERAFDRSAIASAFGERFRFRTVDLYEEFYSTLRQRARSRRMPTVAVMNKALWKSQRRAGVYRPLMYCSARGCPVLYVDPEEVDYKAGTLVANGIEIDMVAFPSWDLVINERKRLVKILKAIADGAVDVFSGLSRGLLASYKVVFEMLSSSQYAEMFPSEVRAALAEHVPWTRLLRERRTDRSGEVDLIPHVVANRAGLVIKPAGGGGGGNITIGRDVDDATWAAAIQRGLGQGWIVQELVVPERQWFPVADKSGAVSDHDLACEYTPYVWNGDRLEGALCRAVEGNVISDLGDRPIGIANGVETATWIVGRR
ncbi:MAG TPA: hypothetical protein VGM90_31195 [Kofleriaceae bacterium]